MRLLFAVLFLLSQAFPAHAIRVKSFGINTLDEIADLNCDEAQAIIWNNTLAQWECDFAGGDISLKTANESITNSTVLQEDDELFFGLVAHTTYTVQGVLIYTSAVTNPDVTVAFEVPTAATMTISVIAGEGNVNVGQKLYQESGVGQDFDIAANDFAHLQISGVVITGDNAGDFMVKWAQQQVHATPTIGVTGSFINFRRFRP